MAANPKTRGIAIALALALVAGVVGWRVCSSRTPSRDAANGEARPPSPSTNGATGATSETRGLSAPIAGIHSSNGDVIGAALDVPARGIRVQRINEKDELVRERVVFSDLAWSPDAELKIAAAPDGVAVTWRGLRKGKLVRELVVLGADLAPKGEPTAVGNASCATRDGLWFIDGARTVQRRWNGVVSMFDVPRDKDTSLLCGVSRAYAVVDDEIGTSLLPIGSSGATIPIFGEKDFGDDEQRERSEYTVGDDVGFVRMGDSGSIAIREVVASAVSPLRRLKTAIPKDDDVVAVDASTTTIVIVYSEDVSSSCPPSSTGSDSAVSTHVSALRIDRRTLAEEMVELSPGLCGHEVGPFFTGALGDAVSVSWVERTGGAHRPHAPIVGLAQALVAPAGAPKRARIDQPSDALASAECDADRCYAVALARAPGDDGAVPGRLTVLRYGR